MIPYSSLNGVFSKTCLERHSTFATPVLCNQCLLTRFLQPFLTCLDNSCFHGHFLLKKYVVSQDRFYSVNLTSHYCGVNCLKCHSCDTLSAAYFRAAAMTLRTVLLSIQALLGAAEPDDPQDAVVAKQYKENPEIFRKTAIHWTSIHASGMHIKATILIFGCVSLGTCARVNAC